MAKIVLLSVIAVSISAQYAPEHSAHEFGNLRVNEEGLRANPQHRHRNEHLHVGGFQNGHFAQNDGRLRTNLDSRPSNENYESRDESPFIVEEGAAFRRPAERYDVHSSLGRVVDISSAIQENNNNERRHIVTINVESRDNGRRDQRRTNANSQTEDRQIGQNSNEQINSDQNSQTRSYQENQNKFNTETQAINQESINQNQGQANSRQSGQNIDNAQETNSQNRFGNQNTQQGTVKNTNSAGFRNNKPVSNVNNESPVNANQGYDKEARDREINNQITRMIFNESVMEETTSSNTKTTKDNELPRNNAEKEDDRWIWSDGVVKNVTTTATPGVDDRAAFVGDKCPTGQTKLNNVCVEID